ncbi:amino acid ABC transporter permease [Acidimicrobiaceae bacterium]|nr:amino acid ABC transporter permease [Acidimicrobiaceae bacterium]|tara:strand:+ start:838 stop:1593 length:756 start_codon:yes stop_codon:yes gene_type:complete
MIKKIFNVENSWVFIMLALITWMVYTIISGEEYIKAFNFIIPGIRITFGATFVSFLIALILGLFLGIGRISENKFLSTISRTYIEFVRGIPILILIFTMAFVVVVDAAEFFNINNGNVPMIIRAIIALSVFYGAYIAEVFRAGIESVPVGQREGGASLGLSKRQVMRHIVLPQAFRNMLPALGNDFISMMKDSSLLSVLAVQDLTYKGRLYSGSTFRFPETYLVLTVLYLCITLLLSSLQRQLEKKLENSE